MALIKWDSWREIEDMFEGSPYKTVKVWINLFDYNYRTFHQSLRQDLTVGRPFKFKRRY